MQLEKVNNNATHKPSLEQRYLVPLKLIDVLYTRKQLKELRLLLILKLFYPGKFNLKDNKEELLSLLSLKDHRTLRKMIISLSQIGIIGYDPRVNMVFVRNRKRIQNETDTKSIYFTEVIASDIKSLKSTKAWVASILVKSDSNKRKYFSRVLHSETKSGTLMPGTKPRLTYIPELKEKGQSNRYLATRLGASKSRIQRDLRLAELYQTIYRKRREVPLEFREGLEIVCQPNPVDMSIIYKDFPELFGRVFLKKIRGSEQIVPHIRISDLIITNVKIRRRR